MNYKEVDKFVCNNSIELTKFNNIHEQFCDLLQKLDLGAINYLVEFNSLTTKNPATYKYLDFYYKTSIVNEDNFSDYVAKYSNYVTINNQPLTNNPEHFAVVNDSKSLIRRANENFQTIPSFRNL
jgi:hypothetical protein